jgi:hypothetical protein
MRKSVQYGSRPFRRLNDIRYLVHSSCQKLQYQNQNQLKEKKRANNVKEWIQRRKNTIRKQGKIVYKKILEGMTIYTFVYICINII